MTASDWRKYTTGRMLSLGVIRMNEEHRPSHVLIAVASIPGQAEWAAELRFDLLAEPLLLWSVAVVPRVQWDEAGNVPLAALQDLRLSEVVEQTRRIVRTIMGEQKGRPKVALVAPFRFGSNPGRRGRSDIHYAEIARLYVGLLEGPAPVKALATQLGLKEQAARDLIRQARRRGLLTPPEHGRAMGALTPRARELLDGQH